MHLHLLLVRLPQQLSWHQSSSAVSHVSAAAAAVAGCAMESLRTQLYEGLLNGGLVADSLETIVTLLVVGVMDDARGDILADGNISLSLVERLSQVRS